MTLLEYRQYAAGTCRAENAYKGINQQAAKWWKNKPGVFIISI